MSRSRRSARRSRIRGRNSTRLSNRGRSAGGRRRQALPALPGAPRHREHVMSSPHATILPHQGTGPTAIGALVRAALPRAAFDPCPERGLIALALVAAILVCGLAMFRAIEHPFAVLPLSALCGG